MTIEMTDVPVGTRVKITAAHPECLRGLTGSLWENKDGFKRVMLDKGHYAHIRLLEGPAEAERFTNGEYAVYVESFEVLPTEDTAPDAPVKTFTQADLDHARTVADLKAREDMTRQFEEWKARAAESLLDDAEEHDYCTEAEEALVKAGFDSVWRERSYTVTATISHTFTLRVSTRGKTDDNESIDEVDWQEKLAEELYEMRKHLLQDALSDVDVSEDRD